MIEKGWSLRRRLTFRVLAIVIFGWTAMLGVGLAMMWREMGEIQKDALTDEAELVLKGIRGRTTPLTVEGENLRIVTPAGTAGDAPWPPRPHAGSSTFGSWQIYRASDTAGYSVEVGSSSQERRQDFFEATRVFVEPMVPILVLLILVVGATTRSAVAPMRDFAQGLGKRDVEDLSPVAGRGLPVEFAPVPRALNHYLRRLRSLREAERQFVANAAHELRTPLAGASAQAQLLAEGKAGAGAARTIAASIRRLSRIVERLLQLARAEAAIPAAEGETDLVELLRMLLADVGTDRVVFDDGDIEGMLYSGDPDTLAIMLRNLLDNALVHGTGQVRVTLRPGPTISVSNPVEPDAAFREEPFARGPASGGSGLGLSIIRATAAQTGFRLSLAIADGMARVQLVCNRSAGKSAAVAAGE